MVLKQLGHLGVDLGFREMGVTHVAEVYGVLVLGMGVNVGVKMGVWVQC